MVWLISLTLSCWAIPRASHAFVIRLRRAGIATPPADDSLRWAVPLCYLTLIVWLVFVSASLCLTQVPGKSLTSHPNSLSLSVWMGFLSCLGLLALIDAQTRLLPNELNLLLMLTGFAWQCCQSDTGWPSLPYLWGMVLGYLVPRTINAVVAWFGPKTVIGLGDAKLLAGLGIWLGAWALPVVWIIASLATLVYTAGYRLFLGSWQRRVPFGPFLALGAGLVVFLDHV